MPRTKKETTKTKGKKTVQEDKKKIVKELSDKELKKPKVGKYYEAMGKRKTASARVRLLKQKEEKTFLVNEKPLEEYFPLSEFRQIAKDSLKEVNCLDEFGVSVSVKGGGLHAQAEAIKHGIARALVLFNPIFRKKLQSAGFLKRDPRMKERKKFGLKKARRAPQWQKR